MKMIPDVKDPPQFWSCEDAMMDGPLLEIEMCRGNVSFQGGRVPELTVLVSKFANQYRIQTMLSPNQYQSNCISTTICKKSAEDLVPALHLVTRPPKFDCTKPPKRRVVELSIPPFATYL